MRAAGSPRDSPVRRAAAAVVLGSALVPMTASATPAGRAYGAGTVEADRPGQAAPSVAFAFQDEQIAESSGLATSGRHEGIVWTINDSGDSARVFAVDARGRTVAVYRLGDLVPRDWEAIAPGRDTEGRPALFVADIGDNSATRDHGILVHVVTESSRLTGGTLTPTSYRLRYPDGPVDAEAVLVHPRTNRLRVVTKGLFGGAVFEAPAELDADAPNVLAVVDAAPSLVTDGTYLPDGRYALRDYSAAYLYAADGTLQSRWDLPRQDQGESLAATADGSALLAGSEGVGSEVWRVPLPGDGGPASTAASSPPAGSGVAAPGDPVSRAPYVWAGGGLVLLVLVAFGWMAARLTRRG